MNTKQAAAIGIILLMLLSTIGFTVFYQGTGAQSSEPPIPDLPTQPATTLRYGAEFVPGTVVQMLPSIRIAAATTATQLSEIDAGIQQFSGVRSVRSEFRQSGTGEKGLLYVADISFDKDLNRLQLVQSLADMNSLSAIDSLSFALVEVPKTITLVSENKDLNLSREHTFSSTIVDAFVTNARQAGDSVSLSLAVDISGTTVQQLLAYETPPAPPQLEQKQAFIAAEISALLPEARVQATLASEHVLDINALETRFAALEGIPAARISLPSGFDANAGVSVPVSLGIVLSLEKGNEGTGVANAQKLLEQLSGSAKNFVLTRSAEITREELDSLPVPEGVIPVQVLPTRKKGEPVEFVIHYLVLGEQILTASGVEAG